ncbi:MAG: GNAT family N-acetyltransferase [Jatrophihabitantaceae bacterium]
MLLEDIQNDIRASALGSPNCLRVGPFLLWHNPDWNSRYANYAIPDAGAAPTAGEVAELVAAFDALDRLPRLEYVPSCAPRVEPALLEAGFVVENHAVLMSCEAAWLVAPSPVPGLRISEPADEDGLRAIAAVQHLAYDEDGEPGAGQLAWLRRTCASGGLVALGCLDGVPVAAGVSAPPVNGLSELTGLAVAAQVRGRGVGAAVAGYLTGNALARGSRVVWLEPGDPDIQRIYARLGYRDVGEKLNISLPGGSPSS